MEKLNQRAEFEPRAERFQVAGDDTTGLLIVDTEREFSRLIPEHDDRERVQRLCDRLNGAAQPPEASQWVGIMDRAPIKGQRVIYFFDVVGAHVGLYEGKDQDGLHVFAGRGGWLSGDVTHWMPISFPTEQPDEARSALTKEVTHD